MNQIKSLALAFGSVAVFAASFASANTVTPLSPVPAGTYGDKGEATLVVGVGSAELELPCSNVSFGAIDFNAENGKFSTPGEMSSSIPSVHPAETAVTLAGSVSNCEPNGACRTSAAYITATLSNAATGVVIGNYAFIINAAGVAERCE